MGRHKREEAKERQSRGEPGARESLASLPCGHDGMGSEQQGLKPLDTMPWGLTWLWAWTC